MTLTNVSGPAGIEKGARPMASDSLKLATLDKVFRPSSIAVIGASPTVTKIGGVPVAHMRRHGFSGKVFPVNPSYKVVQDLPAYPTIGDVPGPADVAIIAVPAIKVAQTLSDAAAAGVAGVIVFSSGFAEVGAEGTAMQSELADIVRRTGIRMLGPNCLGLMDIAGRAFATFSPVVNMGEIKAGGVGIVSQSGAFGAYAYSLARERGIGLSHWITTGNEVDIDVGDCIAWLANDPATKVILTYIEGCRNGPKLAEALEIARAAGKPVIATKVGRTALGAAAAASHTAALAGDDAVYNAFLRQHGAYRAYSIEEFFDVGYAASIAGAAKGNRVGLVTVSGGVGILMADEASERSLDVAELPADQQDKIKQLIPFGAARNPIDVTGQVTSDLGLLGKTIDILSERPVYDSMVVFTAGLGLTNAGGQCQIELARQLSDRHLDTVVGFCSLFAPDVRMAIEAAGCMAFEDPTRAIRALSALSFFGSQKKVVPAADAPAPIDNLPTGALNEAEALQVLRNAGIPCVKTAVVQDRQSAERAAAEAGFPVVLKIVSADIPHKSDIGGVVLNLKTGEEVGVAFDRVIANARKAKPNACIDGVLVAPMIKGGVECILGVQRDPVFGPVVMFGLGGIFVEVLKDVSFRIAPFDEQEAMSMIREIRSAPILDGARGAPPADVEALARALAALSRFAVAAGDRLKSLDMNPFVVLPRGEGALALDAVLNLRD